MHSILSIDTPIPVPENSCGMKEPFRKEVFPAPLPPPSRIFKTYFAGMFSPFRYHNLSLIKTFHGLFSFYFI